MSRGNSDNLKRAAQAKREAARARAEKGLLRLLKSGGPVTFQTLAQEAGVSKDFLYRTNDLRERIMDLRDRASASHTGPAPEAATDGQPPTDTSSIVRTLTAKLAEERSASRRKITELEAALAAAQGQLLQLRRQESTGDDRPRRG